MFSEFNDKELLELVEREKFICFFNFKMYGADGNPALDGFCKIAQSADSQKANYFSLVFIFDTPNQLTSDIAHRIPQKLGLEAFKRGNPEITAITSLPATVIDRPDHYIHTIDLIFPKGVIFEQNDITNAVIYTLRHCANLDTDQAIFWNDDAPESSEPEKSYMERVKAFLGLK